MLYPLSYGGLTPRVARRQAGSWPLTAHQTPRLSGVRASMRASRGPDCLGRAQEALRTKSGCESRSPRSGASASPTDPLAGPRICGSSVSRNAPSAGPSPIPSSSSTVGRWMPITAISASTRRSCTDCTCGGTLRREKTVPRVLYSRGTTGRLDRRQMPRGRRSDRADR